MADRILAEPKELTINKRTGMVVERVNPLLRHPGQRAINTDQR